MESQALLEEAQEAEGEEEEEYGFHELMTRELSEHINAFLLIS